MGWTDQEDQRKIRAGARVIPDTLCEAQRRVTLRKLADLGIRVTDHARWWRRLGERWGADRRPAVRPVGAGASVDCQFGNC